MNKNTRWALALVGVVILVVAAVVIGTNRDSTTATESDEPAAPATDTKSEPSAPTPTSSTGGGNEPDTGGASPQDGGSPQQGDGTGGASPGGDDQNTGGAPVGTTRATTPLLRSGTVKTIKVKKGDTVYIRARSSVPEELHIHGYDLYVDVPAGKTVSYKFTADIEGVFEIEQHGNGEQVAVLKVSP